MYIDYKDAVYTDGDIHFKLGDNVKTVVVPVAYELNFMSGVRFNIDENVLIKTRERYSEWNNDIRRYVRKFSEPKFLKPSELTKDTYIGVKVHNKINKYEWEGVVGKTPWGHIATKDKIKTLVDNNDFWWFVGRYIGDGWVTTSLTSGSEKKVSRVIVCCAKDEKEELKTVLDKLPYSFSIVEERTVYKFITVDDELSEFLKQFGKYAHGKHLTDKILALDKGLLKSFLDGYFSADGYHKDGYYKLSSVSERLIYDTAKCIMKVYNRPVSIYKTKRPPKCVIEGRVVNQRDTYTVTFKQEAKKQDRAFYEDGYVWSPINSIEKVYNVEMAYISNDIATINNIEMFEDYVESEIVA